MRLLAFASVACAATTLLSAQAPPADAPRVGLFDTVSTVLTRRWPDAGERKSLIEPLAKRYRARARAAATLGAEVAIVQAFLSEIPSSHLGLTSVSAYRSMMRGVAAEREPMFGLQLMRWDGRWFASTVLHSGPAHRAGIRAWDEILEIDGVRPDSSPWLDMRSDDAFLPDERDPPIHRLIAGPQSIAEFRVRKSSDSVVTLDLAAEDYSAWDGTVASVRVIERDSIRIGYIALYYMYDSKWPWISSLFSNEWAGVDAVMLDLRGRGGSGALANSLAMMLSAGRPQRFAGPVVALQDRQTRSAKEMLADLIRTRDIGLLVGEPTAGAVVPVRSVPVGSDLMLMLPVTRGDLGYINLEQHPVEPHVPVPWGGPLSGATDPIFEAGVQEVIRLTARIGRGVILPLGAQSPPPRRPR